jgi:3-methyladenine DNA glycosylase AlkD
MKIVQQTLPSVPQLRADLCAHGSPKKAAASARFFKTGKGEYAEGDRFIGVTVPELRAIAKRYRHLTFVSMRTLLRSVWHEERLIGLFLIVDAFERGDAKTRERIYRLYLAHTRFVNNWDLVDSSAEYIVGPYCEGKSIAPLRALARSRSLWERRIAIVATHHMIRRGSSREAIAIATVLLHDTHDLIHKAVGWMLREVGVYCSRAAEEVFLKRHAAVMPRTMLRYAIEHFPPSKRHYYMRLKT